MPESPTRSSTDQHGYRYVENADWWKDMCASLPCFAALKWPDYDTAVIEAEIARQPVVIQLWKGWCQRFLGLDDFPGGIGAEVGIYRRIPGKKISDDLSFLPDHLRHLYRGAAEHLVGELWWPDPDLQTTLEFELVNPRTHETFFRAGPERTYWLCKWMDPDSYGKYREDQHGAVPPWSSQYVLKYTIDGHTNVW